VNRREVLVRGTLAVVCAAIAGCGDAALGPRRPDPLAPLQTAAGAFTGENGAAYVVDARTQVVGVYATAGARDERPLAVLGGPDTDIIYPSGVAVDRAGRIYVANAYYPGSVAMFAADEKGRMRQPPLAVISGGRTGIDNPVGVALDAAGRIYVANDAGYPSTITVYAANPRGNVTTPPLATIGGSNTNLHYVQAIALGPQGQIAVVNGYGAGSITEYRRDPRGGLNEAPRATIAGGSTGLNGPAGVAIDAARKVYVTNTNPSEGRLGNVTVYAPPHGTFSGSPLAVIGGIRSRIQFPRGIGLDASGQIYVTNQYANTITVYAPNPSGDVTGPPIGRIEGPATGLAGPVAIAIH
jgi:6-phosphogluconolactonase (cycloisomerase 2 family)